MKRTDYTKKRAKIKRKAAEIDTAVAEYRLAKLEEHLKATSIANIHSAVRDLSPDGLMMAELGVIEADDSLNPGLQLVYSLLAILRKHLDPGQPCPLCRK